MPHWPVSGPRSTNSSTASWRYLSRVKTWSASATAPVLDGAAKLLISTWMACQTCCWSPDRTPASAMLRTTSRCLVRRTRRGVKVGACSKARLLTPAAHLEARDGYLPSFAGWHQHAGIGGAVLTSAHELLTLDDQDGPVGGVVDYQMGNLGVW
ncbi:MAG: hypothetical protein CM1200mP26_00220 [Acidimicrobiales bacterium]|nr:MAG: hypothetical protein CM1200mP26_00220 [Acidimicrobiales bacterium]